MLPPASQRVKRRGSHALVGPARLRLRGTSLKRLEYPISHRYPTFTTARRNEPPVAGVMERRGHEADPTPPRRTEVGRRSWHWADGCPGTVRRDGWRMQMGNARYFSIATAA